MGADGPCRLGHIAGADGVDRIGQVDFGLAGVDGGDGPAMEHHVGPEGVEGELDGVAVVDRHVADIGGQDLIGQAVEWTFGSQQAAAEPAGRGRVRPGSPGGHDPADHRLLSPVRA